MGFKVFHIWSAVESAGKDEGYDDRPLFQGETEVFFLAMAPSRWREETEGGGIDVDVV